MNNEKILRFLDTVEQVFSKKFVHAFSFAFGLFSKSLRNNSTHGFASGLAVKLN